MKRSKEFDVFPKSSKHTYNVHRNISQTSYTYRDNANIWVGSLWSSGSFNTSFRGIAGLIASENCQQLKILLKAHEKHQSMCVHVCVTFIIAKRNRALSWNGRGAQNTAPSPWLLASGDAVSLAGPFSLLSLPWRRRTCSQSTHWRLFTCILHIENERWHRFKKNLSWLIVWKINR